MTLGLVPLIVSGDVVTPAIVAVLVAAAISGVGAYFAQPKTRAEAGQLEAAASVSISAEAREWTRIMVARAAAAEARADAAETKADRVEEHADEIEAALIECYGYVRTLRELVRANGGTPPALPVKLEALWRGRH